MTPAETAITEAMAKVEQAGCDPLLTEAVSLLSDARNKVADFVDQRIGLGRKITHLVGLDFQDRPIIYYVDEVIVDKP